MSWSYLLSTIYYVAWKRDGDKKYLASNMKYSEEQE